MNMLLPIPSSDATLVRRALADDPRALEALIVRHSPRVHAVVRAIGVPLTATDDAVQDALLHAVRDLRQLRDPERFGAWLVGIARNAARQWLRKQAPAAAIDSVEAPAAGVEPGAELEASELREHVHRQVLALPEDVREAVFVYYYEGRSTRAAARALGISTAALWHRLERAREVLRRRLWRLVADGIEATVPSRAEWRARGRRLSLVLMAAAPLSVAARAAAQASIAPKVTGGLFMSGKKLIASSAVAACIVAGGTVWIMKVSSGARTSSGPVAASGNSGSTAAARAELPGGGADVVDEAATRLLAGGARAAAGTAAPIAVSGRVVDETGKPLAGAPVVLAAVDAWQAASASAREKSVATPPAERIAAARAALAAVAGASLRALTGEDGRFSFRGDLAGEHRVLAAHPQHLARSAALLVARGSTVEVEIELARGVALEGQVTDASGAGIAGAEVTAERLDMAPSHRTGGAELLLAGLEQGWAPLESPVAFSGPDGRFRFPALEPTDHEVIAAKPGHLPGSVRGALPGREPIRLVLERGAAARGRIVFAGGAPAPRVRLRFDPVLDREVHRLFSYTDAPRDAASRPVEAESADDGGFEVAGLVSGRHTLRISPAGAPAVDREVEIEAGMTDLGDVTITPAASISGTVRLPEGAPAAGARVLALAPARNVRSSNTVLLAEREPVAETVADAQGRFTLAGLGSGVHDLGATLAGYAPAAAAAVEAGATGVELQLDTGVELRARIVDAESGTPLSGVHVAPSAKASLGASSDDRGEVQLTGIPVSMLNRSTLWINVQHPDYDTWYGHSLPVWTGGDPPVVRLTRKELVTGVVVDAEGAPVAGARISYEVHNMPAEARGYNPLAGIDGVTGADGAFAIAAPAALRSMIGVPRWSVRAWHSRLGGARGEPSDVAAPGSSWPRQRLQLALCRVEGVVRGDAGAPVAGAWVRVVSGTIAGTAISRRDGTFVVDGPAPGPAEVVARANGHAPWRLADFTVLAGTTSLEIDLERGGAVHGRVLDETGAALPGVEVVADTGPGDAGEGASSFQTRMRRLEAAGLAAARTDESGGYRFDRLPAGTVRLIARRAGYEAAEARARTGDRAPDLVLGRFTAIAGQVMDAESRRPVTRFDIDVIDLARVVKQGRGPLGHDYRVGSEGELTFEDSTGRFVYDGLRPGRFEVIVRARGWLTFRREAEAKPGEVIALDVELVRGGRIEGVVLDAETGQPVVGAEVSAVRQSRAPTGPADWISAASGVDGKFVLEGLADGEYTPGAFHRHYGFASPSTPVRLPAEETPSVEMRLPPAGRIEGRVAGEGNGAGKVTTGGRESRRQRMLSLEPVGEDATNSARRFGPPVHLDPFGRYEANHLQPGRYRLVLKSQAMEQGEYIALGPNGGVGSSKPVGPEQVLWSGEVTIEPRCTTVQDIVYRVGD